MREYELSSNGNVKSIFVDIDGTICTGVQDKERPWNYEDAIPMMDRIAEINRLYEQGHNITYWTARGTQSGIDWYDTTMAQLHKWGAKQTALICGDKPHFDLYICDKSVNADKYFMGRE